MVNDGKVLDFGVIKSRQQKAAKRSANMVPVTEVMGNELDFYKAEMKTSLMTFITSVISGVKQVKAADNLGITQAQVSMIRNKRISQFSIDKLMEIAWKAGYGMELHPQQVTDLIPCNVTNTISKFGREVE